MRSAAILEFEAARDRGEIPDRGSCRSLTLAEWASVQAACKLVARDFYQLSAGSGWRNRGARRTAAACAADLSRILGKLDRQS